MKGIFKSKPRTPAEIVRRTRELLVFADLHSDMKEAKREEKCKTKTNPNLYLKRLGLDAKVKLIGDYDVLLHDDSGPYGSPWTWSILFSKRYVLESEHMKKFFSYIQLPNFDIASDASATFKFFAEYNSKLLQSPNYITRRQAVKLLGDILLDRANVVVMVQYVNSKENLRILMNLLRESSKNIQLEAFHVFKLNQDKPADIINILVTNSDKLLRFLSDFKPDKEDEQFNQDKAQVVREIASLVPQACS